MRYIYKATNRLNGKVYVGQTYDYVARCKDHLYDSSHGSDSHFHCAIRKHGANNFVFELIEECEDHLANDREIFWVSEYDSYNRGYNSTTGGQQNFHLSDETKQKLRIALTGRKIGSPSSATRQKIREANTGKRHSLESRKKMSETKKSQHLHPVHSDEAIRKMSESKKGMVFEEEHKQKLSEAAKKRSKSSRVRTEETRKKISEARKRLFAERRAKLSEAAQTAEGDNHE